MLQDLASRVDSLWAVQDIPCCYGNRKFFTASIKCHRWSNCEPL